MLKQAAVGAVIASLLVTGVACGTKETPGSTNASGPAKESTTTGSAVNDQAEQMKAYLVLRLAEEKVNGLFHEKKSKDGKAILNPLQGSKEVAETFLKAYFDDAMTNKLLTHYLTEEKADNSIVVKADKFFAKAILDTTKADVTMEGSKDGVVTITTKDGAKYTLKNTGDKYIITDYVAKQ